MSTRTVQMRMLSSRGASSMSGSGLRSKLMSSFRKRLRKAMLAERVGLEARARVDLSGSTLVVREFGGNQSMGRRGRWRSIEASDNVLLLTLRNVRTLGRLDWV